MLVVENGTGLPDAESYISVAEADSFFALRYATESDAWTGLDVAAKEALLRQATDYMVAEYRMRWKGVRVKQTQALDWPRAGVVHEDNLEALSGLFAYPPYTVPENVVPVEVRRACAILALKAIEGDLAGDLDQAVISESVGPVSVTYDRASPQITRYRMVDAMLAPYLRDYGQGIMAKLVR